MQPGDSLPAVQGEGEGGAWGVRLMPGTPRGWLTWATYTLEAQGRPFSPRLEYTGRTDPRMRSSREEALSVKILAERASKACSGNGVGFELLMDFYVGRRVVFLLQAGSKVHSSRRRRGTSPGD